MAAEDRQVTVESGYVVDRLPRAAVADQTHFIAQAVIQRVLKADVGIDLGGLAEVEVGGLVTDVPITFVAWVKAVMETVGTARGDRALGHAAG